jgi:hypothetical protein
MPRFGQVQQHVVAVSELIERILGAQLESTAKAGSLQILERDLENLWVRVDNVHSLRQLPPQDCVGFQG